MSTPNFNSNYDASTYTFYSQKSSKSLVTSTSSNLSIVSKITNFPKIMILIFRFPKAKVSGFRLKPRQYIQLPTRSCPPLYCKRRSDKLGNFTSSITLRLRNFWMKKPDF